MSEQACPKCQHRLHLTDRTCPVCSADIGFPNVRYAERADEVAALEGRVRAARDAIAARSATDSLEELRLALEKTRAVMNRRLTPVQIWLSSNNPIFRNFYHEIEEGRVPTDDRYNRQRASAENTINPGYYRNLSIAALSFDGMGLDYYGEITITLNTSLISHRATVFEENPFYFNERHAVISGQEPPPGYRATWDRRADLGIAKLYPKVTAETHGEAAMAELIMGSNRGDPDCDFIEVHIYDGVHRETIEHVRGPRPSDDVQQIFWDDVRGKLEELGAMVEEI